MPEKITLRVFSTLSISSRAMPELIFCNILTVPAASILVQSNQTMSIAASTYTISSLHFLKPKAPFVKLEALDKKKKFAIGSLVIETVQKETPLLSDSIPRRLVLLRHAKSSWDNRTLRDHDRPLSKSGQVDAIEVSRKLQQLGWVPELILSSDAVRTRETLKIMQEHVPGFLEAEVHFVSSFYSIAALDGQTAEHLQKTICQYSRDDVLTIMCMGHNRGWEEAASMLSGTLVELKTCNAALLEANGKSWEEAFSVAGLGGWKLHGIVKPEKNT